MTVEIEYQEPFKGSINFETNDLQIWYPVDIFLYNNSDSAESETTITLRSLSLYGFLSAVVILVAGAVIVTQQVMDRIYFSEKEEEEKMLGEEYTYDVEGENEVVLEEMVQFEEEKDFRISEGNLEWD